MNPSESEIESELRALRPRPPGSDLERRIGEALANSRSLAVAEHPRTAAVLRRGVADRPRWWQGIGWAFAGAVAAVVVIVAMEASRPKLGPVTPTAQIAEVEETFAPLEHIDASAEILAAEDDGYVFTEKAEPVRRVRFTSYERHVWSNPSTGALMEYTVPREDIRLTPIALQ